MVFAKKYLNFIIFLILLFGILSIIISNLFDKDFIEKYIDEDNNINPPTILRIYVFQKQTLAIGISLIIISLLLFIFRKVLLRNREVINGIAVFFVTLLIFFILGEFVLRLFFSEQIYNEYGNGPGLKKLVKEDTEFNSEFFRDKEREIIGTKNRILVLGDSFVFGWGIRDSEDRFSNILEAKLSNYEVINFGIIGANTEKELEILKEYGLKYNPDLVIMAYVLNDAEGLDSRKDFPVMYQHLIIPYEVGGFLYQNSFMYYFIESRIFRIIDYLGLRQSYIDYLQFLYDEDSKYLKNQKIYFKEFKELDIPILLVIFPINTDLKNYPLLKIHEQVKDLIEENGIEVLDLYEVYKDYNEEDLVVSAFDSHPNELGHKLAAEAIYEKLKIEGFT